MQVIAWRTVSEMSCNVSSGTLNLTHSLTIYFLSNKSATNGSLVGVWALFSSIRSASVDHSSRQIARPSYRRGDFYPHPVLLDVTWSISATSASANFTSSRADPRLH